MATTEQVLRTPEPMAVNMTIGNTSPGLKRKSVDDDLKLKNEAPAEMETPAKKAKLQAATTIGALVELNGRKLVYKSEPLRLVPARKRLHEFSALLVEAEDEGKSLTTIPESVWNVVATFGQESTARTEALFVKQLKSALTKGEGENLLATEAVSALVPKLFRQRDFGFVPSDFASTSVSKVPASLSLRIWETQNPEKYLSAEQLELVRGKQAERDQVRQQCSEILAGLDDVEKLELIKGEKGDKLEKVEKADKPEKSKKSKAKETGNAQSPQSALDSPQADMRRRSRENTATTNDSRRSMSPVKKSKMTPEEEEISRRKKEEREARKAEKAERKAAEEREEERKKAVLKKQANGFSSFFKAKAFKASPSRASPAGPSDLSKTATPARLSDYERTFRKIQKRPNIRWAEINRWNRPDPTASSPTSKGKERASSDGEGHELVGQSVSTWSAKEFIQDHLQKHKHTRPVNLRPRGVKTFAPQGAISVMWEAYQSSAEPRLILTEMQDREKFPWKTLAFDQQTRPPYCGTWSKSSVAVGPRTPLAQDPVFDYSYDSSDDWQDEEDADADDVDEPGQALDADDDDPEDESEGEFDDFFDDTEEVPYGGMDLDDDVVPLLPDGQILQERLPLKVVKKAPATRKVVKLTPTWKGPLWEASFGEGTEGMEEYQIQLLNGTPASIDPFQWVSDEPTQAFTTNFTKVAIGANLSVKCLIEAVATVATVAPLLKQDPAPTPDLQAKSEGDAPVVGKPKASGPKVAFPEAHLPELLRLIHGNTKIRNDLVSELRAHFETVSTKAAIEAKIREVAVREGKAKDSQWKVKPEVWTALQLEPTTVNTQTTLPATIRLDSSTF